MKEIWYVSPYEPLPLFDVSSRKMRNSHLTDQLIKAGSKVNLWLPDFDHVKHQKISFSEKQIPNNYERLTLTLIPSTKYSDDVSLKRYFQSKYVAVMFFFKALCQNKKPDIIISQVPSLDLAFACLILSKIFKCKFVVDVRDLWPKILKQALPQKLGFLFTIVFWLDILFAKYVYKNSEYLCSVSKSYLNALEKDFKRNINNDQIFYLGYEPKTLSTSQNDIEQIRQKYSIKLENFVIFFSGNFGVSYDLDLVAKVIETTLNKDKEKNILFVICGGGDACGEFIEYVSALENVIYAGWVNGLELDLLMQVSDIGFAPYKNTALMSLPNKLFEYIANGLPILNTLDGEMASIIEKYSIGLNVYSHEDSVSSLYYLYENREQLSTFKKNCLNTYNSIGVPDKIYVNFAKYILEGK